MPRHTMPLCHAMPNSAVLAKISGFYWIFSSFFLEVKFFIIIFGQSSLNFPNNQYA